MSHNNYFTTIKRRIHQHMNNRVGPLVFFRKTENHQIFFSQPTFIGSDSAKYSITSFKSSSRSPELLHTRSKIHLNYHLTEVNSSIIYQNTQVNSDNSGTSEKSSKIAPTAPPLLGALTLNKSSCEICILRQISQKNLIFAFPSL